MRAPRPLLVLCAAAIAAACGGGDRGRELTIEQYAEVPVPGVAGFDIHVGDITVASVAPITITRAADAYVIAKGNLRKGDELPFVLRESGPHVVTVVSYRDRLVADEATLRIDDRRPTSKRVVLLPLGTLAMPSIPDIKLTLEELAPPRVRLAISTPTSNVSSRWATLGESLTFELRGAPYELQPLSFDGRAVYVLVGPRRR